ncbi:hypothetical protein NECAME_04378 [Necator americanus]|uniref:Uncharacterized protein n=1 Tax=Necator americanus TaxID=51031 RepID=W2STV4_NECAM|nr:hypothetical protein NECAME_04378 [Necator americanus]ETN73070.1 hypothetical protein NECAME_04378 [Necator americanus]
MGARRAGPYGPPEPDGGTTLAHEKCCRIKTRKRCCAASGARALSTRISGFSPSLAECDRLPPAATSNIHSVQIPQQYIQWLSFKTRKNRTENAVPNKCRAAKSVVPAGCCSRFKIASLSC